MESLYSPLTIGVIRISKYIFKLYNRLKSSNFLFLLHHIILEDIPDEYKNLRYDNRISAIFESTQYIIGFLLN